jgi:CRP-like cAMP-binding protein
MARKRTTSFNPSRFFTALAGGATIVSCGKNRIIFSEGDAGDAVFYVQKGWVTLGVASPHGRQVVVAILERGGFFGEACLGGQKTRHTSATSMENCSLVRIDKHEMLRVLRAVPAFSELFVSYLLARNLRIEADLVDQLSNSSERRLARLLLLLAHYGKEGKLQPVIPKIRQQTLADMVGTTRSRVSFFLNRFRTRGFIAYNGRLKVHGSLATVLSP